MKRYSHLSWRGHVVSVLILLFLSVSPTPANALYKETEEPSASKKNSANETIASPKDLPQSSGILKTREKATEQELVTAQKETFPQYAPNQIIIKFKADVGQSINAQISLKSSTLSFNSTGLPSVDSLNAKHKVKTIEPVFKALKEKQIISGKSSKQLLAETKSKFKARSLRAPKNAEIPDLSNIYKLELENPKDSKADIFSICEEYKKDPTVEYCEPNYIATVQIVPNDPYYSSTGSWGQSYRDMWGLQSIHAEQAWDVTQGSPDIVVAVSDTGIDYNHPDIQANIWHNLDEIPNNGIDDDGNGYVDDDKGYNFAYGNNNPMDDMGHGTHVAGTIAAVSNNNLGVTGISWYSKVMAVKGLDTRGSGYESWLANTIVYATDNGADVINMSWGGSGESLALADAITYADSQGAILVAAAGNSNADVFFFHPANLPQVIAVAALKYDNSRALFSNWGEKISVAAPGVNVLSLRAANTDMYGDGLHIVNSQYYYASGTSMAAPHVAGAIALLLAHKPTITNEVVRQILTSSADDIGEPGSDIFTGAGCVNANRALDTNSLGMKVKISSPAPMHVFQKNSIIPITGTASGPNFQKYQLFYAKVEQPSFLEPPATPEWAPLNSPIFMPVENGSLATWNMGSSVRPGMYLLKLAVTSTDNLVYTYTTRILVELENIRRVTFDQAWNRWLSFSDSRISWLSTVFNPTTDRINVYNLRTETQGEFTRYNSFPSFPPTLSGNYIVWAEVIDQPTQTFGIYLYDFTTNIKRQIVTVANLRRMSDSVTFLMSGNLIAWLAKTSNTPPGAGNDIYLYDLMANTTRQITNSHQAGSFAISGNRIVWIEHSDIYLCDLTTNTTRQITNSHRARPYIIDISGDRIIWLNNETGYPKLCLYDLTTNTTRHVTNYRYDGAVEAKILDDLIVWTDTRGASYSLDMNIYSYNLATGTEMQVTSVRSFKSDLNFSQGRIVWIDERNGHEDIYTVKLLNHPPSMLPISNKVVSEGELLTFSINGEDVDNDTLIYSADNLPSGATFDLDTHVFKWKPNYYQSGTYENLHFTVTDGDAAISENISVTVNNTNGPPEISYIGSKSVNAKNTLQFTVKAMDPDKDKNLFYSFVGTVPPGTSLGVKTGAFRWMPTSSQRGNHSLTFKVTDSLGASTQETITVTVKNNPPNLNPISKKTVSAGKKLTVTFSATDKDQDTLTYTLTNPNPLPQGVVLDSPKKQITWTPAANQKGIYQFKLKATDGHEGSDYSTFKVEVK